MPIVSPQDEAAVKSIVEDGLDAEIFAFARCMVDDIRKAEECGVDGVVIEIPSSGHIIERAYGWPLERAIELSIEATLAAKEAGLYTVFFTIDSSRAEFDWYLDLVERVATEGHMDALALVDTFGGVTPQAIPVWVEKVRERLPDVRLEAHFHDDFGLAVANSIAATRGRRRGRPHDGHRDRRAGRQHADGGARARADDALRRRATASTPSEFYALSRLVRERAGHTIPSNRPAVGERLFEVESGIIAGWFDQCIDEVPDGALPISLGRGRSAAGAGRLRQGQRPTVGDGRARGNRDRGRGRADARAGRGDQAASAGDEGAAPARGGGATRFAGAVPSDTRSSGPRGPLRICAVRAPNVHGADCRPIRAASRRGGRCRPGTNRGKAVAAP